MAWDSTGTSSWVSEWIWTGVLRDAVFSDGPPSERSRSVSTVRDIESLDAGLDVVAVVREEAGAAVGLGETPTGRRRKLHHRFLAQVVRTLWGSRRRTRS